MVKRRGILIGTHYEYPFGGMARRPEWLPDGEEDWRRDLEMIKDTGFDSIRVRIGLESSVDEVDRLLDICEEVGIGVLFGFATFYAPYSLFEEHPDAKVIDRKGEAFPSGEHDYRWPRACIDHPEYRRRRNQLVADCAKRFGAHPAVLDWDIHNEPAIGAGDNPCYCNNTVAKYRRDLAERFPSVAELNQRWATSFREFADVQPPREFDPSPTSFWRGWREFSSQNLSEFLLEAVRIIKEHVPGARVSFTYAPPSYSYDIQSSGVDWWILPQLDYASISHYCRSGSQTAAIAGSEFAWLRALVPDKEVWLTEVQGGVSEQDLHWRGIHIDAEVNEIFSHAGRALYFYRWEPIMRGAETGIYAMVDADTYETERRLATKRVISEIREYEDVLAEGSNVRPRVGIYLTREMLWSASARKAPLRETVLGLYGLFLDMGFEVAFVTEEFSEECDLDVVAIPFTIALSEAERQSVDAYVSRGGRAIAELPMASLEDCQAVGRWLGLECREWTHPIYYSLAGWSMNDAQGRFGGFGYYDRVLVDDYHGRALASYRDNDAPALISAGPAGRLLVPTFALGRSYFRSLFRGVRRLVGSWLPDGLEPDVKVQGAPEEYRPLMEARVVESPKGNLLFVINRSGYDWEVEVAPRGYRPVQLKLPHHGGARRLLEKA